MQAQRAPGQQSLSRPDARPGLSEQDVLTRFGGELRRAG